MKRQQQKKAKEDLKILFFFFTSFLNGKTKKRGVFVFLFCRGERLGFQNKKLEGSRKTGWRKNKCSEDIGGLFSFFVGIELHQNTRAGPRELTRFLSKSFFFRKCLESAVTAFFSRENQLFRQVWLAAAVRHPKQAIGLLKSNNSNTNLVLVQVV